MLFFLPLAAIWLLARRRSAGLSLLLSSRRSSCVAPWTIRNHRVYGRFVLVASEGGVTFWTGNHPLARRRRRPRRQSRRSSRPSSRSARAHPGLTPEAARAALLPRRAGLDPRGIPSRGSGSLARKLFYTVVPVGPSYSATLGEVLRRVGDPVRRCCSVPAVVGALAISWRRGPAADRALAGGARDGHCRPRVFPAGTVPDSRDRSGADRDGALRCAASAER